VTGNAALAQKVGSLMIKWIVCDVAPTRRVEFSRAQELWAVLRAEDGFVCQVGGWDEKSHDTAGVLAVWKDAEAYERFMRDHHDAIVRTSGQQDTYRSVRVATGPSILEMRGDRDWVEVLLTASVLTVADCVVLSGHEHHFRRVQEHVWSPGMAGVDGMLGGLFSQVGERRYLATTGWRDARSHERYAHDLVPALGATAGTAGDLLQIESYVLSLMPAWTVCADGNDPQEIVRPAR
jgi:Domain of unknown function (DUF4937